MALASVLRCAESPTATAGLCPPEPGPDPAARAVAAALTEPPPADDAAACRRLAACLRPPHVVPPAAAQPFLLRGFYRVNHDNGPSACISDPVPFEMMTWYVLRGQRFTTTRLEVNGLLNYSPGNFGATVWRNDRAWFTCDQDDLTYPNGVQASLPRVSKVAQWLASDWAGDGGCTSFGMPFPSTFLPGEKIGLTGAVGWIGGAPFVLGVSLAGYLYPQESVHDPDYLPTA